MSKTQTQNKIKLIYREISKNTCTSLSEIDSIVSSMWEFLQNKMEEHPLNAIYLRHLGTFYGKESMGEHITENKIKKDEHSNR